MFYRYFRQKDTRINSNFLDRRAEDVSLAEEQGSISDRRTEEQKTTEAAPVANDNETAPVEEVAPVAERGGKRVDIEDVIAVYEFGKSDAVAARKQPDVYERFIDDLKFDRQMAIAWSKGDPASRKPDYWEYWKEREGLSEPVEGENGENGNAPLLLDVVRTLYSKGKEVASKLFQRSFFDVAQTPKFMQELGLRGDKFTIKYGVIARHLGKDSSHTLTERDWEQLPQALQNPFAISKLTDKNDSYRIYTTLKTEGGEFVVVGADVKNAGREIEINAISTVFGRRNNANLPKNEEVIYKSKEITPEQSSLLERPNFAQYPTEQELSADKGSKKVVDVQEYVAKWNDNTGEKVQVANSVEEVANTEARAAIEQGVKVKGWYDTRTGEVVVYAPNVKSAEDLVLTIVHENVSHKGLRDTLGEDIYNKMCDKTWEMMDEATRAKYESYAGVNSIKDETKRHRAAADEYIASIAEKVEKEQKLTESERSIWSEVLKAIKEFIVKLYGDVKLTEQDIASIIRVSYDRMRARGDIEANSGVIETAPVVEAPKAENKVRKPSAKKVEVKAEEHKILEEQNTPKVAKAPKAKTAKKKAGEDIAKIEEAMQAQKAQGVANKRTAIENRLAEIREEYEADKEGRNIQAQADAMVELYGGYANAPKDVKAKIDAQVAKLSERRQELAAEERELEAKLKSLGEGKRFRVESLVGDEKIFEGMRKLEEGETSHVERVFTENKNFEFTTKNRIESYDDVAYIFKELENEAVENTFVALVKDGKPTVIHLGMGTSTASMVDFISANVAVRRINPDKIYFVHNHPSGMLKASQQDMNILDAMKNAFGENVVQDGIIINTFSGKYGTFGAYGDIESSDIPRDQEEFPIKVHSFSKSVYDRGYKPTPAKSSTDIAAFITSQRLGERPKIGMIVANNQLQIIGNIFLPYSEFTEENADAIANDIAYYTSVMGGNAAFLFGNAKLSEIEGKGLRSKVESRANKQIRLLDYIEVDGGRHKSANDNGTRFSVKDVDKKTSISERSDAISGNSSSNGLLRGGKEHLSHIALTTPKDVAKLQQNSQNTINSARKQLNAGGFNDLTTPENAVRELGKKLKLEKSLSSQSYYGEFYEGDFLVGGRKLNLRVSTHPASGHRIGNSDADDKVSIVIYKNGEHYSKEEHAGYVEYIYDEKDVSLNDAANAVLKGVINLIENGEYIDETQKAKFQEYPYVDENGNTRFRIGDVDKDEQLRIIQETNPAPNDVNTWVRSVDDIKTFEEALKDSDYADYAGEDFDDSYTWDIVEDALRSGEIEVYSSKPIVNGVFVTPSRMEAESYGDGNVYRAKVRLGDVAWIDPTQGQLATNNEVDYKRKKGQFRFRVGEDADYSGEGGVRFAVVEDEDVLRRFEEEPLVKTYRAMVKIGDQLYPPMSSKEEGKLREGNSLGDIIQSEERPDLAIKENGRWVFKLDKGNKKGLKAAYNPYIHSSDWMLNDQFMEAGDRPELVVVEMGLLPSDIESGYHAEKAKDSTGVIEGWKSGDVAVQLPQKRKVWLTQYGKILREVPTQEVAEHIYKLIDGYVDVMPTNVVSPQVREALEKMGVKFVKTDNQGYVLEGENAGKTWATTYGKMTMARKAKGAKKAEGGVRFRFIGEQGAKSMDKKEGTTARMDNLAVAKKMLSEYSYKEVKMATGWEQGMDGKWRYETPDFEQFDINGNLKFVQRHPDYARYRELVKKSKKTIDKYNIKMHRRVQKGSPMLCFIGGRGGG